MSYQVAIMFVETIKSAQKGKIYYCHLLRHNYRENDKVKHKHNLSALLRVSDDISVKQGLSVGAVWLIYQIARRLGLEKALGKVVCHKVLAPNKQNHRLLKAASVIMPEALPGKGIKVATKRTISKKHQEV